MYIAPFKGPDNRFTHSRQNQSNTGTENNEDGGNVRDQMSSSRCRRTVFQYICHFSSSHPSDLKHRFHRLHSSSSLHGSFNHHQHAAATNLPLVPEEHEEHPDKGPMYDPKQEVFVSLFVRRMVLPYFGCLVLAPSLYPPRDLEMFIRSNV